MLWCNIWALLERMCAAAGLPSLYWTASLLLHSVSYRRCLLSSPLLSWCCWQVLTTTVESCWRCTCRLQDEEEQRWRNTVKSGMTGERQTESKGDRVCFIWMCTCAQPCLDWFWMFVMGNSQQKLYYNRMQMMKRRCRTVTARQQQGNAGTEERWNQKMLNIKTLLHAAGHFFGGGGDDLYSWWSLWDIILNPALHCSCFAESFCGLWIAARVGEVVSRVVMRETLLDWTSLMLNIIHFCSNCIHYWYIFKPSNLTLLIAVPLDVCASLCRLIYVESLVLESCFHIHLLRDQSLRV